MLTIAFKVKSQDIHFSQFLMTPFLQNSSFAGKSGGDFRAIVNHRNQWRSLTAKPFQTTGVSFDMNLNRNGRKDNFFGIGVAVYHDRAGSASFQNTLANLNLAYHIKMGQQSYFSCGLLIGMDHRSFNPNALEFDSQFDGSGHNASISSGENFNNISTIKPSVGGGISYSWVDEDGNNVINNNGFSGKKINVGFAVQHFNSPNFLFISDDKLGLRYTGSFNSSFGIPNTNLAIQPSGFIFYQKKAVDLVLGSMFRYTLREQSRVTGVVKGTAISLGAHYRVQDAVITSFLIEIGGFGFGFSYDINVSSLTSVSRSRGGFELSLRYVSPNPFGGSKSQARFF